MGGNLVAPAPRCAAISPEVDQLSLSELAPGAPSVWPGKDDQDEDQLRRGARRGCLAARRAGHGRRRRPQATVGVAGAKPYFDSRTTAAGAARAGTTVAAARPSARTRAARGDLRRSLGREGVVSIDPLTGTPRQLLRTDGALRARAPARADIALEYVRANRVALGLDAGDLDGLEVYRQASPPAGSRSCTSARSTAASRRSTTTCAWRSTAPAGCSRSPAPRATTWPSRRSSRASAAPGARASAAQRRRRARGARPLRPERRRPRHFASGDFARLVLFGGADGARLAWHVTYRASSAAYYDAVVDAASGAVLYRQNLIKAEASAEIYPNHPGASPRRPSTSRTSACPGATVLDGTFSRLVGRQRRRRDPARREETRRRARAPTSSIRSRRSRPPPGLPGRGAVRVGSGRPRLMGDQPRAERRPGLLPRLPLPRPPRGRRRRFTDEWGNFEVGGTGGDDPVLTQADDGADTEGDGGPDAIHSNNANMPTPPDGESPRMQMYLFEDSGSPTSLDFRSINGGDDSGVVWHEYTHGLSNRLVINADGSGAVSSPQSGAMGEAWSDWYASDLQVRDGLKDDALGTPGEVDVGDYTDLDPHALRSQALDCPVGVVDARARAARRPASAATRSASSARSPAPPRCTPTARSGPRRCGTCARRCRSRSAARRGLRPRRDPRLRRHAAVAAGAVDARHAQRDPGRRAGRLRRRAARPRVGRVPQSRHGLLRRRRPTAATRSRSRTSPCRRTRAGRRARSPASSPTPTPGCRSRACASASAVTLAARVRRVPRRRDGRRRPLHDRRTCRWAATRSSRSTRRRATTR